MKAARPRHWLVFASLLALAGCVTSPAALRSAMPGADVNDVSALLERYDRLCSQPVDEQRREFTAAQTAFERDPVASSRLRLALALSLPQAPWRDDARLISLLAEWVADPNPSLMRQVAQLLYRQVTERQRLIKEEQRRAEVAVQTDQKLLHEERKKTEELQQKLDALRQIDRHALKPARR